MTRIELAEQVFDDFDRFFDYIAQFVRGLRPSASAKYWKRSRS